MKKWLLIFPLICGLFVAGVWFVSEAGYISAQEATMGIVLMGIMTSWFTGDTYFAWKDLGYIN